jgi:hypothetical protein
VIVATAMFPAIADLHQRSPDDVESFLRRAFTGLLIVAVPIGLGTIIVAPRSSVCCMAPTSKTPLRSSRYSESW